MLMKLGEKKPLRQVAEGTTPAASTEPEIPPTTPTFDFTELTLDSFKAKLGEGAEFDEALAGEFITGLNAADSREKMLEVGLTAAQKLIAANAKEIEDAWKAEVDKWKTELTSDPIAGSEQSLAAVKKTIQTYAGQSAEPLFGLLDMTGIGNNIHFVRFVAALAKAVPTEGTPVTGEAAPVNKSQAQRLFGG